jgi:uncharacterized protein (TIGR03067 family)
MDQSKFIALNVFLGFCFVGCMPAEPTKPIPTTSGIIVQPAEPAPGSKLHEVKPAPTKIVPISPPSMTKPNDRKKDELEGMWTITSVRKGEAENPFPEKVGGEVVISPGGKGKITWKDGTTTTLTYGTATSTTPKTADITVPSGLGGSYTGKFIYSIDGDTLRVCGGGYLSRPKDFLVPTWESEYELFILKRKKE